MGVNKQNLKYKTFDSLLADVEGDFKTYTLENLIEPQDLIRVAKWVTKDLGLKIYKTKEIVLELNHGKVRLPDDFYVFNYGLLCDQGSVRVIPPQATTITEVPWVDYQSAPAPTDLCTEGDICPKPDALICGGCKKCNICTPGYVEALGHKPLQHYGDPCIKPRIFMDCRGDAFELIQVVQSQTKHWKRMLPLKLVNSTVQVSCNCPNLKTHCSDEIEIKDGFLFSNIKSGTVYLNYEGILEDDDGNLLIPDHEILTLYYEYKLKDRILENLLISGEDVERVLDRNSQRLRSARIEARSLVNMPEFSELNEMWELNRRAYNLRYVNMFKTLNWLTPTYGYGIR